MNNTSQAQIVIRTWLDLGMSRHYTIDDLDRITPRIISSECAKKGQPIKPNRAMLIFRVLGFKLISNRLFDDEDFMFHIKVSEIVRAFGTSIQIDYYLPGA